MLNRIQLFTGGCRSGKSREALEHAVRAPGERIFLATCPRIQSIDQEMDNRILKHQSERGSFGFRTVEESVDLVSALKNIESTGNQTKSVVVDCVSLWVNNCMYEAEKSDVVLDETQMISSIRNTLNAARKITGHVFFVTNEVGLGLVPENKIGRLYRDLLGRANQEIARAADEVTLMISGLPLKIKSEFPSEFKTGDKTNERSQFASFSAHRTN